MITPVGGVSCARDLMQTRPEERAVPALAFIFCETRPAATREWTGEARFLLEPAPHLFAALTRADLHGRGHPDDLSVQVSAEALFEDGDITGRTCLNAADLAALQPHLPEEQHARVLAWAAFAYALESQGNEARFVIWFVQ